MRLLAPSVERKKLNRQSGLTLVEILVASTLLLFITLGLTAMFNQTSRAFRTGVRQVDVLESGRAALQMISRDIEQMTATQSPTNWSLFAGIPVGTTRTTNTLPDGSTPLRTNYLQDVYVTAYLTNWQGLGYRVLNPNDPDTVNFIGVGTLYRFSTNAADFGTNRFFDSFAGTPSPMIQNGHMRRVIDGVVHFHINAYDQFGRRIMETNAPPAPDAMVFTNFPPTIDNEYPMAFWGSTLPVMVEVELGIFEPATYEQLKPLLINPAAAQAFVGRNGGRIHIFRQQIPIRPARQ